MVRLFLPLAVLLLLAPDLRAERTIQGPGPNKLLRLPSGVTLRTHRIIRGKLSAPLPLPRPQRMAAEILEVTSTTTARSRSSSATSASPRARSRAGTDAPVFAFLRLTP